jgi:hypothetical protein
MNEMQYGDYADFSAADDPAGLDEFLLQRTGSVIKGCTRHRVTFEYV